MCCIACILVNLVNYSTWNTIEPWNASGFLLHQNVWKVKIYYLCKIHAYFETLKKKQCQKLNTALASLFLWDCTAHKTRVKNCSVFVKISSRERVFLHTPGSHRLITSNFRPGYSCWWNLEKQAKQTLFHQLRGIIYLHFSNACLFCLFYAWQAAVTSNMRSGSNCDQPKAKHCQTTSSLAAQSDHLG